MENIEEKQSFLRKEIIDKGYDPNEFSIYLSQLKEGDLDLDNWSLSELREVVNQYKSNNKENEEKREKNENQNEVNLNYEINNKENEEKREKNENQNEVNLNNEINIKENEEKKNNEEINNLDQNNNKEERKDLYSDFEIINKNEERKNNNPEEINENLNNNEEKKNEELLNSNINSLIPIDLSKNPLEEISFNIPCLTFLSTDIQNIDDLNIDVSDPILIKGGFFSRSTYKYTLTTLGLNYKVERKLSDFDWLYNTLNKFYPGLILSPIPVKHFNLKDDSKKKITYIKYFINSLSHYKPIRSSQIFLDFITIPLEQFQDKINEYEHKNLPDSFSSFTNLNGEIRIIINEERDNNILQIKDDISKKIIGYNKLTYAFNNIISSFENCKKAMNDLSDCFNTLSNLYIKEVSFSNKMDNLKKTFEKWSKNYEEQSDFFMYDLKYFFKFYEKELNESLNLFNEYKSSKDLYLKEFQNSKKNNKNNKEDLQSLNNLRKHYGYYLSCFLEEYKNLIKRHDERMIHQFKKYSGNTNVYVQDYQNFIKLINTYFE